jgi:agmatine/peptidylarginine deiminase
VALICLVPGDAHRETARRLLAANGLPDNAVHYVKLPLDSMWVRDYGPLFVQRPGGSLAVLDAQYVPPLKTDEARPLDDQAASRMAARAGVEVIPVSLKIEWGNILSNGDGLAAMGTTALSRNASDAEGARRVVRALGKQMALRDIVFVNGLTDEPSGHVDMVLAFLAPDVVVVGQCDAAADPQAAAELDEAARRLASQKTSRGPVKVHRVPMPPKRDGVWRSYTNVVFANGVLLVPSFSDVNAALENEVMSLYARLLPGWKIVGIDCDSLADKCGFLHCICMNVPGYVPLASLIAAPAPAAD